MAKIGRRLALGLLGAFLLLSGFQGPASAQSFPSRTITIVVPFAPGGGVDLSVRRYADLVSKSINQPVIVVNRPGGGGIVGANSVLATPPDGYTLFLASPSTHASLQALQTLPFDPLKDFKPVTLLFYFANVLVISNSIPAKNLDEFVKYAKTRTDGLVYGSQGHASPGHILAAMLASSIPVKGIHTPFKNGPEMNLALVKGEIDYGFGTYQGMQEFWRAGQVKIIAAVGPQRAKVFPDYPTLIEAGYPDFDLLSWYGLVAPAGTPDAVINTLVEEFKKAGKDPGLQEFLAQAAFEGIPEGAAPFAALMARETARYSKIIPSLGIKAN